MNKQTDINKKVEKALESLDGIHRAEPRPFLFTRIQARLDRDQKNIWETIGSFLTRPVVTVAGLCVILTINVFILTQRETPISSAYVLPDNTQSQEDESIFAVATTYDYENLEP